VSAPTAAERIAAAQAKREAIKASEADAFVEQQATDLEALVELEDEHGFDRVVRIDLTGWRPGVGAATMVVARVPLNSEKVFKRFEDTVSKKDSKTSTNDAGITLARACLVYPADKALLDATMELAPGVLSHLGLQLIKAVQGSAEEEKKG
jgi:hypothetical protein